jgi:hypothetical protein
MWPALTALTGALLSFGVQPLVGKLLLPRFGGGSAVWTVCLLFFQAGLLLGYAWAHLLILRQPLRRGLLLHLALLATALLALPLGLSTVAVDDPLVAILAALAGGVGLPYVALTATAPLLQAWQARTPSRPDAPAPWRLYAWSNVGSLTGLLAWPALVEPWVGAQAQQVGWSVGMGLFVVLLALCAVPVWRAGAAAAVAAGSPPPIGGLAPPDLQISEITENFERQSEAEPELDDPAQAPERPRRHDAVLWVGLTAASAAILSATTDRLTEDVAAGPLLWVLPLALYLLSYILVFAHERWGKPAVWRPLFALSALGLWWVLHLGQTAALPTQLAGFTWGLFAACMALHGELVRIRPPVERLTSFYLATAFGGVLGGLSVAWLAPRVLDQRLDLPLALLFAGALLWWAAWRRRPVAAWRKLPVGIWAAPWALWLGLAGLFAHDAWDWRADLLALERGFFGVVAVRDDVDAYGGSARKMLHGRIMHGRQSHSDPRRPVAYYGPRSGLGLYFEAGRDAAPRRVVVLGLGVGTVAAFGRCGDHFDFVEIDPIVERIARRWFTYLADTCATTAVQVGDGRKVVEDGGGQAPYDLIVLDAFTGDAVPTHLLTHEAFEGYLARLSPTGVIAVNVSNRHLDLRPVVRQHAHDFGRVLAEVTSPPDGPKQLSRARWMLLSVNQDLRSYIHAAGELDETGDDPERRLWTDDYAPWLGLLRAFR